MHWTPEAEKAIKKVPFFVRKKVRFRVERDTKKMGKNVVTLTDVNAIKAAYLSKMSSEIKGFQIDSCFGPEGCPNCVNNSKSLMERIEDLFKKEDLLNILKKRVQGSLKFHHEFRVTLAECPNACSQPQIKDIGIISACIPKISEETCTLCNACVEICREKALSFQNNLGKPVLDHSLCLKCGKCIDTCPSGTIITERKGFRVQLGGKLGRHPKFALELPWVYSELEVLEIVKACVKFYKINSVHGERFAEIFKPADFDDFSRRFVPNNGAKTLSESEPK